jgi:hypothetical protein
MGRKKDIRQIDSIVRKAGLSKGQRRLLHEEITGRELSYQEILDIALDIKRLYPNK